MKKFIVLYNPLSGNVSDKNIRSTVDGVLPDAQKDYYDITKISDMRAFLSAAEKDCALLIVGGDGTLNKFVNATYGTGVKNVWYFAAGNGNDFWNDLGKKRGDKPVCVDEYIAELPTVTVNGKDYKFINGIGYGIDGYCCEKGDKLKAAGKKVNYTSIAVKGLLFHHKPSNATVIVDGEQTTYKKVWIAPSMFGRFYGGGMMPTPAQDRTNAERKLSLCVMHGAGKIKTLMVFPSIFKGEHVKKTKLVAIKQGHKITVKFDRPTALQIDGETITGVREYTVTSVAANQKEIAA